MKKSLRLYANFNFVIDFPTSRPLLHFKVFRHFFLASKVVILSIFSIAISNQIQSSYVLIYCRNNQRRCANCGKAQRAQGHSGRRLYASLRSQTKKQKNRWNLQGTRAHIFSPFTWNHLGSTAPNFLKNAPRLKIKSNFWKITRASGRFSLMELFLVRVVFQGIFRAFGFSTVSDTRAVMIKHMGKASWKLL